MRTILVTGASGFMGRNLVVALQRRPALEVLEFDLPVPQEALASLAARADMVFHLAGVNRTQDPTEFTTGNAGLTRQLCADLTAAGRRPPLVLSSSIQAALDNPYGRSKLEAEQVVRDYQRQSGAPVRIYRLPNVFGKWSRPNYNTVVATFCHRVSRGQPVEISNPATSVRFVYIDDVVQEFLRLVDQPTWEPTAVDAGLGPVLEITLGELHALIRSFRDSREVGTLPDLSRPLVKYLYSTYLSFCDPRDLARPVDMKRDPRGWLFELFKSPSVGQVFVSRTRPGVTRGNHYHDTKTEKFCVIQGEGVIRFRQVRGHEATDYAVKDSEIRVVDIPPGYVHSIENTGSNDMITLFWASEVFDPDRPDTYPGDVLEPKPPPPEAGRAL